PMRMPDNQDYDDLYGTWSVDGEPVPVASTYRVAWREMAATTGFRTLYPALIPPGSKHVHAVNSAGPISDAASILASACASTLVFDLFVKSTGSYHIYLSSFDQLSLTLYIFDCVYF